MEGQIRDDFIAAHPTVEQQRPFWEYRDKFLEEAHPKDITVLICQHQTKKVTQMCIESIQRFYPDIKMLIVDDNSQDDSSLYLRYKELTTPNVKVWWRTEDYTGHGNMLHQAILYHIQTEYILILDSDVVFDRGGFLEPMLKRFDENHKLYAIGTLQYASYQNNGGEPFTPEDAIPYANPHCSIYHIPTYHELVESGTTSRGGHVSGGFLTDGAPCILNMKAAFDAKLDVEYFPTDQYTSHNSGSSWAKPPTIWMEDHDVMMRPFITFIINQNTQISVDSNDNDFDIVIAAREGEKEYTFTDKPNPHPFTTQNKLFSIRFNIYGEYVADCTHRDKLSISSDFITEIKKLINEQNIPDEVEFDGIKCVKRKTWQKTVR